MGKIAGIRGPGYIQTKQLRIAKMAKEQPERVFTSLAHHIDVAWMHEAFRRTKKGGAVGVDGESAEDFEKNLMENLKELVELLKSGRYKAPPVRRIYLDKGNGKKRKIGIPTFADKVLQRAVKMVLEPLFEQDFYDCSDGFRPERSAHHTLIKLEKELWEFRGCWLVEIDIKGFFDNIDHKILRKYLDQRVRDGVLRRAIDKWLRAGIVDGDVFQRNEMGTPQGGVISPLLGNILLHKLLDEWFTKEVIPNIEGARIYRYADDIILTFRRQESAEQVLAMVRKRFEENGLELHPEKTRLIDFRCPFRVPESEKGEGRAETFDLLGFTIYWSMGKEGYWNLRWKTRKEKIRSSLKEISKWCRDNRHQKVGWQHRKLSEKLRGHYAYFGLIGNWLALAKYKTAVCNIWYQWLSRRSQKRFLSRTVFNKRLNRNPLPPPKTLSKAYIS